MDVCSKEIKSDFKNAEGDYSWLYGSCHPPSSAYSVCGKQEDTEKVKSIWKISETLYLTIFHKSEDCRAVELAPLSFS